MLFALLSAALAAPPTVDHHNDADCSKPSARWLRAKYCLEWNFLRPHNHHDHHSNSTNLGLPS
jgi:hypothetical protein